MTRQFSPNNLSRILKPSTSCRCTIVTLSSTWSSGERRHQPFPHALSSYHRARLITPCTSLNIHDACTHEAGRTSKKKSTLPSCPSHSHRSRRLGPPLSQSPDSQLNSLLLPPTPVQPSRNQPQTAMKSFCRSAAIVQTPQLTQLLPPHQKSGDVGGRRVLCKTNHYNSRHLQLQ